MQFGGGFSKVDDSNNSSKTKKLAKGKRAKNQTATSLIGNNANQQSDNDLSSPSGSGFERNAFSKTDLALDEIGQMMDSAAGNLNHENVLVLTEDESFEKGEKDFMEHAPNDLMMRKKPKYQLEGINRVKKFKTALIGKSFCNRSQRTLRKKNKR